MLTLIKKKTKKQEDFSFERECVIVVSLSYSRASTPRMYSKIVIES